MAKKRVAAIVKIQIPAGKASPAPPVGTALGPHGVAIMDFVKAYNAATEAQTGKEPGKTVAGKVTEAQVAEIAEIKMRDLNAYDLEAAKQQVRGTARSMGINVVA